MYRYAGHETNTHFVTELSIRSLWRRKLKYHVVHDAYSYCYIPRCNPTWSRHVKSSPLSCLECISGYSENEAGVFFQCNKREQSSQWIGPTHGSFKHNGLSIHTRHLFIFAAGLFLLSAIVPLRSGVCVSVCVRAGQSALSEESLVNSEGLTSCLWIRLWQLVQA